MEDNKKSGLMVDISPAISKQKRIEAESEIKKREDEKTKKVVNASRTFLETIGAETALERIRQDLFNGGGVIGFFSGNFQREDVHGGSGASLQGGNSSISTVDYKGFFAGYTYNRNRISTYDRRVITDPVYVGFVGITSHPSKEDARTFTHFIVSERTPEEIFKRYDEYHPYSGNISVGFHTWRTDLVPVVDAIIGLDYSKTEEQDSIDKVVSLLSTANTELLQTIASVTTRGLSTVISNNQVS